MPDAVVIGHTYEYEHLAIMNDMVSLMRIKLQDLSGTSSKFCLTIDLLKLKANCKYICNQ
jgi:hypothetical protein